MTDGIKFGQTGSSKLQSLSVRLPTHKSDTHERAPQAHPPASPAALVNHLASSISNNIASKAAIGKLSSAAEGRKEVAEANTRSSKSKVEDVEKLARDLADRISENSSDASNAHRPSETAHDLLSE